jgi:hydroxymethylpyrimidine/phosphomethylpyrimidine kinase
MGMYLFKADLRVFVALPVAPALVITALAVDVDVNAVALEVSYVEISTALYKAVADDCCCDVLLC